MCGGEIDGCITIRDACSSLIFSRAFTPVDKHGLPVEWMFEIFYFSCSYQFRLDIFYSNSFHKKSLNSMLVP
jgi:hypothetical protein